MKAFDFEPGALPGSLELAYLGDSVYDLYVRARLVREGGHVRAMHRAAVSQVCSHAQAQAFARVEGSLTERERDVARRARNAHFGHAELSENKNIIKPGIYHHRDQLHKQPEFHIFHRALRRDVY